MTTYRVRGIYVLTLFVDVDEQVEAENESEAILVVQDHLTAADAYDQEAAWYDAGPEVTEVASDE